MISEYTLVEGELVGVKSDREQFGLKATALLKGIKANKARPTPPMDIGLGGDDERVDATHTTSLVSEEQDTSKEEKVDTNKDDSKEEKVDTKEEITDFKDIPPTNTSIHATTSSEATSVDESSLP